MICSLNEVGATLRKAGIGGGLTVGLAEASAAAGVWLCAHGFDGIGAVLAATGEQARAEPQVEIEKDQRTVTIRGTGVGRCGPSVFDLLRTDAIERVVVHAPDSPLLLVGFAGAAARSSGTAFSLTDETGACVQVTARSCSEIAEFGGVGRIDAVPTQWPGLEAKTLPHGVPVDQGAWNRALDLAQNTYVPATEESRAHGAGAGLTDND